jgi:RNA polymerase sigma factor (sigma-70 family)
MPRSNPTDDGREREPRDLWRTLPDHEINNMARLAHNGDAMAEHGLWNLCASLRQRIRRRYHLHQALAEDWVGTLYLRFHTYIEQFDPGKGAFRPYLEIKLTKAMVTWVRVREVDLKRQPQLDAAAPVAGGEDGAEIGTEEDLLASCQGRCLWQSEALGTEQRVILRAWLKEALSKLTPLRRDVILLWADGNSCKEIAEQLGITLAACHKDLERARADLQRAWKKDFGGGVES